MSCRNVYTIFKADLFVIALNWHLLISSSQTVVSPYDGTLLVNKTEWTIDILNNLMNEHKVNHVK